MNGGMMNNMGGNMNGGMPNMGSANNNGLYVPQSGGTSIASIIQKKSSGSHEGMTNQPGSPGGLGSPSGLGNPGGYANHPGLPGHPNMAGQNHPTQFGYGVDSNGYPIPNDRYQKRNGPGPNMNHESNDDYSADEYERMMELANDVNDSLEALERTEKRGDLESVDSVRSVESTSSVASKHTESDRAEETEEETEEDEDDQSDPLIKIGSSSNAMLFIEPILLLTIYVVMSQPFVISFASNYIDQLNPEDDVIPMSGIVLYGLILVIMFLVMRRVVESQFM